MKLYFIVFFSLLSGLAFPCSYDQVGTYSDSALIDRSEIKGEVARISFNLLVESCPIKLKYPNHNRSIGPKVDRYLTSEYGNNLAYDSAFQCVDKINATFSQLSEGKGKVTGNFRFNYQNYSSFKEWVNEDANCFSPIWKLLETKRQFFYKYQNKNKEFCQIVPVFLEVNGSINANRKIPAMFFSEKWKKSVIASATFVFCHARLDQLDNLSEVSPYVFSDFKKAKARCIKPESKSNSKSEAVCNPRLKTRDWWL